MHATSIHHVSGRAIVFESFLWVLRGRIPDVNVFFLASLSPLDHKCLITTHTSLQISDELGQLQLHTHLSDSAYRNLNPSVHLRNHHVISRALLHARQVACDRYGSDCLKRCRV